ncbi:MAG: phosphodiester glycosidase family protein, partial [Anaerovoracaceae bacterium]
MKNRLKLHKRISLGLALSVLLASLPVPVHAAAGYNQLHSSSLDLNNQMTMHQGTYYNTANSSKTSENYLVYKPGSAITPFVSSGNDVYGAAGISRIYEIEEGAGRNIVAASNGDYFTMATGVSLGVLVKDGLVRTGEHSSHESIGFKRNGTAVIGRMGLAVRVYNGRTGGGFNGTGFNKMLTKDNGVMLYTGDFGPTNEVSIPAHNVMIRIVSGTAAPGGTVEGIVLGSADSLGKTALFEDEMLLSIALNTPYTSALNILKEMKAEDKITVEFSVSPGWEDVHQALGAERRLITNGVVSTFQDATRAPRTAFGLRSDGSCVLYTVDGRQSGYSMGLTYAELAARLKELGCVDAVN